jgi:hypothetical protein
MSKWSSRRLAAAPQPSLRQRLASAGAAAMLSLGAVSGAAVATEFDILAEPTPTSNFFIDDAEVLSKSTRSDVNKRLRTLEVGCRGAARTSSVALFCSSAAALAALSTRSRGHVHSNMRAEAASNTMLIRPCVCPRADPDRVPHRGRHCAQA